MQKLKRIFALAGAICLIALYAVTLLLAVFGNEGTKDWLMASSVMTVLIPVLLYAMSLIARVFSGKNQEDAYRKAEHQMEEETDRKQKSGLH